MFVPTVPFDSLVLGARTGRRLGEGGLMYDECFSDMIVGVRDGKCSVSVAMVEKCRQQPEDVCLM